MLCFISVLLCCLMCIVMEARSACLANALVFLFRLDLWDWQRRKRRCCRCAMLILESASHQCKISRWTEIRNTTICFPRIWDFSDDLHRTARSLRTRLSRSVKVAKQRIDILDVQNPELLYNTHVLTSENFDRGGRKMARTWRQRMRWHDMAWF